MSTAGRRSTPYNAKTNALEPPSSTNLLTPLKSRRFIREPYPLQSCGEEVFTQNFNHSFFKRLDTILYVALERKIISPSSVVRCPLLGISHRMH